MATNTKDPMVLVPPTVRKRRELYPFVDIFVLRILFTVREQFLKRKRKNKVTEFFKKHLNLISKSVTVTFKSVRTQLRTSLRRDYQEFKLTVFLFQSRVTGGYSSVVIFPTCSVHTK